MKARDLLILKAELKLRSTAELLRRMGVSETAYRRWLNDEPNRELPVYFALAAAALRAGLQPYEPAEVTDADLALYGGERARKLFGAGAITHDEMVKADRL